MARHEAVACQGVDVACDAAPGEFDVQVEEASARDIVSGVVLPAVVGLEPHVSESFDEPLRVYAERALAHALRDTDEAALGGERPERVALCVGGVGEVECRHERVRIRGKGERLGATGCDEGPGAAERWCREGGGSGRAGLQELSAVHRDG